MDPNAGTASPATARRKTSPWVYVGCGCAVLLAIAAAGVLFIAKKLVDEGHKMERGMRDPREREQRTRAVLGYSELPSGYYPAGAFSVPFLLDMAFLGDRQAPEAIGNRGPGARPDLSDHGFIFMRMRVGKLPESAAQRRRMLFGAGGRPAWEQGSGFSISSQESLGDGELDAGGAHVAYRTTRGKVHMNNEHHQALTAILLIECPDRQVRFGFWMIRDPAPDQPASALDKNGTPADPRAIETFLGHFHLCASGG
jgi:hypothetical protein